LNRELSNLITHVIDRWRCGQPDAALAQDGAVETLLGLVNEWFRKQHPWTMALEDGLFPIKKEEEP
jgi:hypothetical protein